MNFVLFLTARVLSILSNKNEPTKSIYNANKFVEIHPLTIYKTICGFNQNFRPTTAKESYKVIKTFRSDLAYVTRNEAGEKMGVGQ